MTRADLILVNLGTPNTPTEKDVRAFLAEFLGDPMVVEKPRWLRPFVRKASRVLLEEFQNCPVCIWSGPTVWQFHDGATSEQLCCTGCIVTLCEEPIVILLSRIRCGNWCCSNRCCGHRRGCDRSSHRIRSNGRAHHWDRTSRCSSNGCTHADHSTAATLDNHSLCLIVDGQAENQTE